MTSSSCRFRVCLAGAPTMLVFRVCGRRQALRTASFPIMMPRCLAKSAGRGRGRCTRRNQVPRSPPHAPVLRHRGTRVSGEKLCHFRRGSHGPSGTSSSARTGAATRPAPAQVGICRIKLAGLLEGLCFGRGGSRATDHGRYLRT